MAPKYILNADKFEQSCTVVSVFFTFEKSVKDGTIPTKNAKAKVCERDLLYHLHHLHHLHNHP